MKEWVKETCIERTDMQISKTLNLSGNINLETLPPKWIGFQPHQEHNIHEHRKRAQNNACKEPKYEKQGINLKKCTKVKKDRICVRISI